MKKPIPNALPTLEYRQAIYQIYLTIFEQRNVLDHNRVPLLTNLFGRQRWSWRVVGISAGAVNHLEKIEFKTAKGLQRDHFIQRRNETFLDMLPEHGAPLKFEDWWQYFWHNDRTVIMTKAEHNSSDKEQIRCYPVNWEDGYFACNKLVGFKYRKTIEGAWVKEMVLSSDLQDLPSVAEIKASTQAIVDST